MKIKKAEIQKNSVRLDTEEGYLELFGITEWIIRCVYSKNKIVLQESALIEQGIYEQLIPLSLTEGEQEYLIESSKVKLCIIKNSGEFHWYDKESGQLYVKEDAKELTEISVVSYSLNGEKPLVKRVKTVDGERNFVENLVESVQGTAYRGKLNFQWAEEEALYGLGQAEEGIYNYRGHVQYLYQHNMRIPMPVLLSSKGYGILVDCASLMTFQDDVNGSYLFMDTIDQLDYYLIAGDCFDGIVAGYRYLTGRAPMLPKWAFGYIQSKEAYHTQEELLQIAVEYRNRRIPLDAIVQDWNSWEEGKWGEKILDKSRYGGMKKVNQQLHDMNIHTMISIWPNMNEGTENHREFVEKGYLLADYATYDAFSPEARKLYWKQAEEGLFSQGFDAWWCDSTEPFTGPDWGGKTKREPWERYLLVGNEHKKYLGADRANAFAVMHAKGIYENQRKTTMEKRVLNLTRSGYLSSQKYGTILWSGDISASWDTLRKQIVEGLNMAMSGIPYWTIDIGAFFTVGSAWWNRGCGNQNNPDKIWFWNGEFNEGCADKGYCELYTRWFEYAAFLPMQRSHGTDTSREIWNFGTPGTIFYDTIEKYIKLRYALMPYIYSLAGSVTLENSTMLRSLMFDFPEDKEVFNIGYEYMFGKAFLVCPVTRPMYYEADSRKLQVEKTWECYLPSGTEWYHYWSGRRYKGGAKITVEAELDMLPLFVKAGSILLLEEGKEYAGEITAHPMQTVIYPGADGSFTLYEDSGDGYDYENGAYSTILFSWEDQSRHLTIGEANGKFPEMQTERQFIVNVAGENSVQLITYSGSEISVIF